MKLTTFTKYIDQPILVNKLKQNITPALIATGAGVIATHSYKNRNEDSQIKKERLIKNSIIITSTIAASLIGAKGLKIGNRRIIEGLIESTPTATLQKTQSAAVDKFLFTQKNLDEKTASILNKAKNNHLGLNDIETLSEKLPPSSDRESLLNVLFPKNKNLTSGEIFGEIKRLSLLGALPVIGGVTGGIVADHATGTSSPKQTANKVKEGFYQYFANIFLCNVGAGAALYGLEKLHEANVIKTLTPTKKLVAIMGGITATGIIGGSYIANYMSKKLINPLFKQKSDDKIYGERKPEALDIALHADDIATAGVLSGLKWIEPALPLMYFVSGYRAGIGYRNVKDKA